MFEEFLIDLFFYNRPQRQIGGFVTKWFLKQHRFYLKQWFIALSFQSIKTLSLNLSIESLMFLIFCCFAVLKLIINSERLWEYFVCWVWMFPMSLSILDLVLFEAPKTNWFSSDIKLKREFSSSPICFASCCVWCYCMFLFYCWYFVFLDREF